VGWFEAFGTSDIGKRVKNEDSISLLPEYYFFAVADGMGGHRGGEVASKEASFAIRRSIEEFLNPQNARHLNSQEIARHIKNAIMQAGNYLFLLGEKEQSLRGLGTTFSCVHLFGAKMTYAHLGDSRIYLQRKDRLRQLTSDHTLISEITLPFQKIPLNYKKMITKALGCGLNVEPTLKQEPFYPEDILLLCSDGLSDSLADSEIETILKEPHSAETAAKKLIETAKKKSGHDNISAIVIKILAPHDLSGQ
jgi:protein phosphatase